MNRVMRAYCLLLEHFGPQHWWPADSDFEIIVGALLMPQTQWSNVNEAIANLKREAMLDPARIATAGIPTLTRLVKPVGLHRSKPRRLKEFCRHLIRETNGNLGSYLGRDAASLRADLLSLDGIGPEIADSILLYAARARVFVVDAYTLRVGRRVGLFKSDGYEGVQAYFQARVRKGVKTYQEYHALIVTLAKTICRPRPKCEDCPLASVCSYARSVRKGSKGSEIS